MIPGGITPDQERVFQKAISRIERSDPVDADTVDNIQAQELLNSMVSLWDILLHLTGTKGAFRLTDMALARLAKAIFPNGLIQTGAWEATNTPSPGGFGHDGSAVNTLYLGANTAHVNGRILTLKGATGNEITLSLPAPPSSGGRTDLVFLEVWCQIVDPKTGIGLAGIAETINDIVAYRYGGRQSGLVGFSSVFEDVSQLQLDSVGEGELIRFQWQWNIRVAPNVNFGAYPDGLGAPNVLAQAGLGQATDLTFSLVEEGLYRAGDGSSTHQELFQTLDGHVWAIPLFRLQRNGGATIISANDITDLRRKVGFDAQKLAQLIQNHIQATGNVHGLKHSEIQNVLGINPASEDTVKDKHVSNADAKRWEDHRNARGNPHQTKFNELLEIPAAFPPIGHGHTWDQITGKPSQYPPAQHGHHWNEISNKPTQYPPGPHQHQGGDITTPVSNSERVGGVRITVSATPPANPSPNDIWIKIT